MKPHGTGAPVRPERRKRLALGRGIVEETQPLALPGRREPGRDWPRLGFVPDAEAQDFIELWRRQGSAGEPLALQRKRGRAWAILGQRGLATEGVPA